MNLNSEGFFATCDNGLGQPERRFFLSLMMFEIRNLSMSIRFDF